MPAMAVVREIRDRLLFVSPLFAVVGVAIFFMVTAWGEFRTTNWLTTYGSKTRGTVLKVETGNDEGQLYYRPTVEYRTQRGERRMLIGRYDVDEPAVGSSMTVYYDPSNSTRAALEQDTGTFRSILGIVFGMFLMLFALMTTGWSLQVLFLPIDSRDRE